MKKQNENTWNKVSGQMTIWGKNFKVGKRTFTKFSTSLGKMFEGEKDYTNFYIDIQFKKDEAPEGEGKHIINITDGFITFDKFEDKTGAEVLKLKIVVMDYEE